MTRISESQFGSDGTDHDIACRYLRARAQDLIDRIVERSWFGRYVVEAVQLERKVLDRRSIVFVDLVVSYRLTLDRPDPNPLILHNLVVDLTPEEVTAIRSKVPEPSPADEVIIEVKVSREPLGDILRQVELYRDRLKWIDWPLFLQGVLHRPNRTYVLAHCYSLGGDERCILQDHQVIPLRLPPPREMRRVLAQMGDPPS